METPACEPTILRFAAEYGLIRIWSKARVRKAANVETKGSLPRQASPTAALTMFCSAMYISKKRSGCASLNVAALVELLTSPSRLTSPGNAGKMRTRALP